MRFRFKSILFFAVILIVIVGLIGIGHFFWTEVISSTNVVVDGNITINYLNGNKFKFKDNEKVIFSVTNNSDESLYYYIQLTDVYADNVNYSIKSDTDLEINGVLKSDILFSQVAIQGGTTHKWEMVFTNNSDKKYSGTFKIGTKRNENNSFSEVVLDNNKVSNNSITNIGEEATIDEGLIATKDDLGMAYYFRGKVDNNNVEFANMNWKIVKINGDGSVKLVLSKLTNEITKYYENNYEFIKANINDYLNSWYDEYLKDYSDYIVFNKFCNDLVYDSDDTTYIAYNRIKTNTIPTYLCLGNIENLKIGLLTADEVMLAGAGFKDNTDYYLYIDNSDTAYWTMTSAVYRGNLYYPFIVNSKGAIAYSVQGNLLRGVRPVINIIKNAKVTGNGTIDNPYKIVN